MVEQIVAFTLGFVICGLIGLAFLPLVSARARRLTLVRIEDRLPMTFDEIEAERDLLRARFAVEKRDLEIKAQEARDKSAASEAEIGRRAVELMRVNDHLDQTAALLTERNDQLAKALEFGEKTKAELAETRESLATRDEQLRAQIGEYDSLADTHRKLDNHAQALDAGLAAATLELRAARARLENFDRERRELTGQAQKLTEENQTLANAFQEAERRNAAFETRRERLIAKIDGERKRADELEAQSLDLRRRLAEEGGAAAAGAGAGAAAEHDLLDLREAIVKIGRDVARLDAPE